MSMKPIKNQIINLMNRYSESYFFPQFLYFLAGELTCYWVLGSFKFPDCPQEVCGVGRGVVFCGSQEYLLNAIATVVFNQGVKFGLHYLPGRLYPAVKHIPIEPIQDAVPQFRVLAGREYG